MAIRGLDNYIKEPESNKKNWVKDTLHSLKKTIENFKYQKNNEKEKEKEKSINKRETLKENLEIKNIINYGKGSAINTLIQKKEIKANKFSAYGSVDSMAFYPKWHSLKWYQPYIKAAEKIINNKDKINTKSFPNALKGAQILKSLKNETNIHKLKKEIFKLTKTKQGLKDFYGTNGTLNMLLAFQRAEYSSNGALYEKDGSIKENVNVILSIKTRSSKILINKKNKNKANKENKEKQILNSERNTKKQENTNKYKENNKKNKQENNHEIKKTTKITQNEIKILSNIENNDIQEIGYQILNNINKKSSKQFKEQLYTKYANALYSSLKRADSTFSEIEVFEKDETLPEIHKVIFELIKINNTEGKKILNKFIERIKKLEQSLKKEQKNYPNDTETIKSDNNKIKKIKENFQIKENI